MFRLTPAAATQIQQAAEAANAAEMALRVAAKLRPDGEVEYAMGFDDERNDDTELAAHGVRVLISKHSVALLSDIELDYVELNAGEFNFIFVPGKDTAPPAPAGGCGSGGTCGCAGKSGPTPA